MSDNSVDSVPWVEKYRPRKLDEMKQSPDLLNLFKNTIKTGNMTHFLFHGPPGTGKTSAILAIGREIFKEYFSTRVIEFNASDDRGINAVREKITNEARKYVTETISRDGTKIPPYKIIILDEADSLTDEAQDALRVIIEQYSTVTRFCFICNYISKVTDAIRSRCSPVHFKRLSNDCMVDKLRNIAKKESMNLADKILGTIIEVSNGDMRKAIMLLQNLKYLYSFKQRSNKLLKNMTLDELKNISFNINSDSDTEINEADVYAVSASITMERAKEIIVKVLSCKNIAEIVVICKEIIATGYPIDNVLVQLNGAIFEMDQLNDKQKSKIIHYAGDILLKIKECANEYIQLLDYLTTVHDIGKNSSKSH